MDLKLKDKAVFRNKNMPDLQDIYAIGRLLISTALLILAAKLSAPAAVSVLIMMLAVFFAGTSSFVEAVLAIKNKDYLNQSVLIILSALIAFCIGCYKESVLLVMLYQLGRVLLNYALKRTRASFSEGFPDEDSNEAVILNSIISQPDAGLTGVERKYKPIFDSLIKASVTVGLIYAVVFPLIIEDMTFTMSVRRGLMLMLASVPFSALVSLPLCALTGISHAAGFDLFFKNAEVLEKTAEVKTVIFDKANVLTEGSPRLSRISSPVFDYETILRIAAYMAYNSDQSIAEPILAAYSGEYKTELVERFADIPGGMEMRINGIDICLGGADIMDARGVAVPDGKIEGDKVLHMSVGGKYAGSLVFTESIDPYAETLMSDLAQTCNIRTVLVSEDSKSLSAKNAAVLGIPEFYYECDGIKKIDIVQSHADDDCTMYVSADSLDFHTAADIDAKVGHEADNADILISKRGVFGLSTAYLTAKRSIIIAKENLIFASLIKLILIVLALTGCATLWFVVFLDLAAAAAAVLNTSRITGAIFEENLSLKRDKK